MVEQIYDWKDMGKCSGADFRMRGRRFVSCARPVKLSPIQTLPLCEEHLLEVLAVASEPFESQITTLQQEVKDAGDKALADSFDKHAEVQRQQALAREERSRVYFMRNGKYIKIGFTSASPDARLATIRKAGGIIMPKGMDFTRTEMVGHIPGSLRLEKSLHRKFTSIRVAGEWFEATPELTNYIKKAIAS